MEGGTAHVVRGDGLVRRVVVQTGKHDRWRLHWYVEIADDTFDPMLRPRWGGLRVEIVPRSAGAHHEGYRWPSSLERLDPLLVSEFRESVPDALGFCRDPRDLAGLLLDEGIVVRGSCRTLSPSGGARALVEALIVARHLGDGDLERRVLATLERRGAEMSSTGNTYRDEVGFFAEAFRRLVPVPLGDIARKGPLVLRR
ncbi:hypothetical protein ACFQX7_23935 [Luedemannella flava]